MQNSLYSIYLTICLYQVTCEVVPVKYIDKKDELHGFVVGSSYVFSLLVSNFVLNSRLLWLDKCTELDHVLYSDVDLEIHCVLLLSQLNVSLSHYHPV